MSEPFAEDLGTVDLLRGAVLQWASPLVEGVKLPRGGEVQLFVYFPDLPAVSLAGGYNVAPRSGRQGVVYALGPSIVLTGAGDEVFFPYVVVRRPGPRGEGVELVYCYPVGDGEQVVVLLPPEADRVAHLLLLEVESEIPGMAQMYFEEVAEEADET